MAEQKEKKQPEAAKQQVENPQSDENLKPMVKFKYVGPKKRIGVAKELSGDEKDMIVSIKDPYIEMGFDEAAIFLELNLPRIDDDGKENGPLVWDIVSGPADAVMAKAKGIRKEKEEAKKAKSEALRRKRQEEALKKLAKMP